MKNKKIFITFTIIFLLIFTFLYVILFFVPDIKSKLTKTYIVNSAQIDTTYDVKALVVRDEIPVYASNDGKITYYVSEGEKTRINTKVADIYSSSDKISFYTDKTGFVSYYTDGLESTITPSYVVSNNPSLYMNIEYSLSNVSAGDVNTGSFIYKLVNGDDWYLMIPASAEQIENYEIGSRLKVKLSDGTVLSAQIHDIIGQESYIVMCKVVTYFKDFCKYRFLDAKVILKTTSGLGIPTSAILTIDGKEGVYVVGADGEKTFTRINLLLYGDSICVISEDSFIDTVDGEKHIIESISLYDEIIRNAK